MELSHKDAENLMEMLRQLPDPRKARGIRHSHASVLAICVCAVLCGAQSYEAIAQWAQCRTQETLKRLHCRYDFKKREYCPPSEPTIRRYLKAVDAQALDLIVSQWFLSLADPDSPLAIDGKTIRGARSSNGRQLHLVSAFLHKEGAVVAQCQVEEKSNEIKAIRPLLDPIDIAGRTATLDALHAQHDTATYIVEQKKADYVITVKDNQPTLKNDIEFFCERTAFPPSIRRNEQGAWKSRNPQNMDHNRTQ